MKQLSNGSLMLGLLVRQVPVPVRTIAILLESPTVTIAGGGGDMKTKDQLHHPGTHTRSRQARISGVPSHSVEAIGITATGGVTIGTPAGSPTTTEVIRGLSTIQVSRLCRADQTTSAMIRAGGLDKLFTQEFLKNHQTSTFVRALCHGGQRPGTRGREPVRAREKIRHLRFNMTPWD